MNDISSWEQMMEIKLLRKREMKTRGLNDVPSGCSLVGRRFEMYVFQYELFYEVYHHICCH